MGESVITDALSEPPPQLALEEVAALLEQRYGLAGTLEPLRGERDCNVKVCLGDGSAFVLKVQNPADGEDVVDLQTKAVLHVGRVDPGLPVTRIVPTLSGERSFAVKDLAGRWCSVRLFSFVGGRHARAAELGPDALFDWGRTTARLGRALRSFFHPAAAYEIQWDIRRLPKLRLALSHLEDEEQRRLVASVLDRFDSVVSPALEHLRHQVVHNDMSLGNVLVDERGHVSGIIDFGDMTHSALVCDLAVVLADVLDGRPDALEMAGPMIAGYQSLTPLEPEEAAVLGDLVAARLATSVAVTAWRADLYPGHLSSTDREPEVGAFGFLRLLDEVGLEATARIFEVAAGTRGDAALGYRPRPTGALLAARRRVLGPSPLSYDEPLHLSSGDGVFLVAPDGRRYLDAYNNVPAAGHGHPEVVRAVAAQLRRLNTNTRYLHEAPVELAEALLARTGGGLDRVLFLNSGSEANDVARRLAAFATGSSAAVVTRYAYHGVTEATTDLSPEEWPPGGQVPGVGLAPAPDGYRGPHRREEGGHEQAYGDELERVVEELATAAGVGAVVVDAAFTSDGIFGPASHYLGTAVRSAHRVGGLFVADEVQAGYGRTGRLWSYEWAGIEPDIVTLGKPMGNGFPVAALLSRAELVDPFIEATGFFSTFGGNTVAAVAGLAVLRVVEAEGLAAQAASVGHHLAASLCELAGRHEAIGDVRAWGLLLGVDLVADRESRQPATELAARVVNGLRRRGILVGRTGPAENVLKLRPPLVFRREHADLVAEALDEVLSGLAPQRR